MARTCCCPRPTQALTLAPVVTACPACSRHMWIDYHNARSLTTLSGITRLTLLIRRCHNRACSRYRRPYRPEAEGRLALPHHEFGLDVIALVGTLRHAELRSVPEIHQEVLRLVREQELPARQAGADWRFWKVAIQAWLSQPLAKPKKDFWEACGGVFKDDPHLEEIVKEAYRRRGRPITEEG